MVLFRGCMVLFEGHAWFYSGEGTCVVLFKGHVLFYSGGVNSFIRGACMVFQGVCVVFPGGGMCGISVFSDTMRYDQ